MVRTKHFFIAAVALGVFLLWLLVMSVSVETPVHEQSVESVIMAEPRDFYEVEYEPTDDGYMRRAIFIEKIRSTLIHDPIEDPEVEEASSEAPPSFEIASSTSPTSSGF